MQSHDLNWILFFSIKMCLIILPKLCQYYFFREQHKSIKNLNLVYYPQACNMLVILCIKLNHKKVAYMHDISVCWAHAHAKIESHRKIVNYWLNISRQRFSQLLICISSRSYWKEKLRANTFYCLACYCSCLNSISRIFQLNYLETKFKSSPSMMHIVHSVCIIMRKSHIFFAVSNLHFNLL